MLQAARRSTVLGIVTAKNVEPHSLANDGVKCPTQVLDASYAQAYGPVVVIASCTSNRHV